MKILTIILVLLSLQVFAESRIERITGNSLINSVVDVVEVERSVSCKVPIDSSEIEWRCLNGPQCGYTFDVKCVGANGVISFEVNGIDTGDSNKVFSINFNYQ